MEEELGEDLKFQKKEVKYKCQLDWIKEHNASDTIGDVTYGTSNFHEYWIGIVMPLPKGPEDWPFIVSLPYETLVHIDCDEKKITVKKERYYKMMKEFGEEFKYKKLIKDWKKD